MRKDSRNVAIGQSRCWHIPAYSQSKAAFPLPNSHWFLNARELNHRQGRNQNRTAYQEQANVKKLLKAVRIWLRPCRSAIYKIYKPKLGGAKQSLKFRRVDNLGFQIIQVDFPPN